jgi:hypothetical protein
VKTLEASSNGDCGKVTTLVPVLFVAARVTVTVCVVTVPSQPVETTVITLGEPAVKDCPADTAPDEVANPPTVIAPPATFAVGFRVIEATALATVAVYAMVVEAKAGVSVPELSTKLSNFESVLAEAVLVTATV